MRKKRRKAMLFSVKIYFFFFYFFLIFCKNILNIYIKQNGGLVYSHRNGVRGRDRNIRVIDHLSSLSYGKLVLRRFCSINVRMMITR